MRQWYALRSKPRKEASAAALLTRAGVEIYLPQTKVRTQHGKPPALEPFFPGYLFGQLDPLLGEIRLATYTSGILYILGSGDQPCPVPDELVKAIRERLERRQGRAGAPGFRAGEPVKITRGPLRDVEAAFDTALSASGRVRVLIRILDRLCRAELDVDDIRRVGQAAGAAPASPAPDRGLAGATREQRRPPGEAWPTKEPRDGGSMWPGEALGPR